MTNVHYSIKSRFLPYAIQILLLLQTLVYNPIRKLLSSKTFLRMSVFHVKSNGKSHFGEITHQFTVRRSTNAHISYIALDVKVGAREQLEPMSPYRRGPKDLKCVQNSHDRRNFLYS